MMIFHWRMLSNHNYMLLEAEIEEGPIIEEEEAKLLITKKVEMIQNPRRNLNRILLVYAGVTTKLGSKETKGMINQGYNVNIAKNLAIFLTSVGRK